MKTIDTPGWFDGCQQSFKSAVFDLFEDPQVLISKKRALSGELQDMVQNFVDIHLGAIQLNSIISWS